MKIEELKIKIKSLAAEARIIKAAEKKISKKIDSYKKRHQLTPPCEDPTWKKMGWTCNRLADHRRRVVRWEARHALIVRRMMKGYSYAEIEPECKDGGPDLQKVHDMAMRFEVNKAEVWKWVLDAQDYYKSKKWYYGQIKVFPRKYIRYPIRSEDSVKLTRELYNSTYVDVEPARAL